jgi:hypothetical protein
MSVIAAAIMLASAIVGEYGIYVAISMAEVPFEGELAKAVIPEVLTLGLIAICFAARLALLGISHQEQYVRLLSSWIISAASVAFYLWTFAVAHSPSVETCTPDGRCFTIYDQSEGLNITMFAGLCFLSLSTVRAVFTAAYAASTHRLK